MNNQMMKRILFKEQESKPKIIIGNMANIVVGNPFPTWPNPAA